MPGVVVAVGLIGCSEPGCPGRTRMCRLEDGACQAGGGQDQ
jgi:hypothetical protein